MQPEAVGATRYARARVTAAIHSSFHEHHRDLELLCRPFAVVHLIVLSMDSDTEPAAASSAARVRVEPLDLVAERGFEVEEDHYDSIVRDTCLNSQ